MIAVAGVVAGVFRPSRVADAWIYLWSPRRDFDDGSTWWGRMGRLLLAGVGWTVLGTNLNVDMGTISIFTNAGGASLDRGFYRVEFVY